jgi:membrane protease YdiL (CAAX protease family)
MIDSREPEPDPKASDQSDSGISVDAQLGDASLAEPVTGRLWPGVLVWLGLCVVYATVGGLGVFELWFVTPLIVVLVLSQAVESWRRTRVLLGMIALVLALMSIVIGLAMLLWPEALELSEEPFPDTIAWSLAIAGLLVLSCLIRRVRFRYFPAIGLDPHSALHTTVAVMFVFTLVLCAGLFALLLEDAGETIPLHLKDPVISLLSDVPLALAGVGFMLRRNLNQSLDRLGFSSISPSEFGWAVVVTVPIVLAVLLFDYAEKLLLPEIHALEDRFPMKFVDVSPVLGIPAVSLAAGVGEEAVFRGALQPRFGIVLTALLFAAMHVQYQLPGIMLIFVMGIVLGIMRRRTSTTFTACVHMTYDIIAFSLPDF